MAKYEFAEPATLEPEEIAKILPQADRLARWAEDIREYALAQALSGCPYDPSSLHARIDAADPARYFDGLDAAALTELICPL